MNKRLIGIIGTLVIHLALPIYLLWPRVKQPPPPPPSSPHEKPVEVRLIPRASSDAIQVKGNSPGIDGAPDPRICSGKDKEYEGIGIIHQMGTLVISSAPASYPAYKAGLRVGDMIFEIYKLPNVQFMFVRVNRYGQYLKFRVPIQKICFNEEPGKPTEE